MTVKPADYLEADDYDYTRFGDDDDWGEDTESDCIAGHGSEEECPFCCNNGGCYQPGTEECDFCRSERECRKLERLRRG